MTEQERLGISDETMKEIKQYLLKTSLPRIIEKTKKEQEVTNERLHPR